MTQLTLFATANANKTGVTFTNEPNERKRKIETFDTYDLARRYATEARGSGKYQEVYLTTRDNKTIVMMEWYE